MNRDLAAKALRIPLGRSQEGSSIFQATSDLLKHLPAGTARNRRAVLLISNGINLFRGVNDSNPGIRLDLQAAIDSAQRAEVTFYTIFANGAAHVSGNSFLITNGQGCLSRIASERAARLSSKDCRLHFLSLRICINCRNCWGSSTG